MRSRSERRVMTYVGLLIMVAVGGTIYLKLYLRAASQISLRDAQIMRAEFDRAHNEAMDESAEWRMKYDEAVQGSRNYMQELMVVREELVKKTEESERTKSRLVMLQKEKQSLVKEVESLRQELRSVKSKCNI